MDPDFMKLLGIIGVPSGHYFNCYSRVLNHFTAQIGVKVHCDCSWGFTTSDLEVAQRKILAHLIIAGAKPDPLHNLEVYQNFNDPTTYSATCVYCSYRDTSYDSVIMQMEHDAGALEWDAMRKIKNNTPQIVTMSIHDSPVVSALWDDMLNAHYPGIKS